MVEPIYIAVSLIGLLHGVEPSHGWLVALLYALRTSKPIVKGFIASCIISFFHLISSLSVVIAYLLLSSLLPFSIPYVNYIAAIALLILAVRSWFEKPKGLEEQHGHIHEDFDEGEHIHEHRHPKIGKHTHKHRHSKKVLLTLKGITIFALILGFAHEEEFALLALAVGGVNPLIMMLAYAFAVTLGIIGITLISVKIFYKIQYKFKKYEQLLPKISALILIALSFSFFLGLR
jgi:ABC-type nickel/cobalt efflux system permease component RcnA